MSAATATVPALPARRAASIDQHAAKMAAEEIGILRSRSLSRSEQAAIDDFRATVGWYAALARAGTIAPATARAWARLAETACRAELAERRGEEHDMTDFDNYIEDFERRYDYAEEEEF